MFHDIGKLLHNDLVNMRHDPGNILLNDLGNMLHDLGNMLHNDRGNIFYDLGNIRHNDLVNILDNDLVNICHNDIGNILGNDLGSMLDNDPLGTCFMRTFHNVLFIWNMIHNDLGNMLLGLNFDFHSRPRKITVYFEHGFGIHKLHLNWLYPFWQMRIDKANSIHAQNATWENVTSAVCVYILIYIVNATLMFTLKNKWWRDIFV